jgi:hypothetical protein
MFDPGRFHLKGHNQGTVMIGSRPPRPRAGEWFLRGPIPWGWVTQAARLPGRTLHVGLAVWFWAGIQKRATIHFSIAPLSAELGVSRTTAYRALVHLERAGLVSVERHRGRKPNVTLLEAPGVLDGQE